MKKSAKVFFIAYWHSTLDEGWWQKSRNKELWDCADNKLLDEKRTRTFMLQMIFSYSKFTQMILYTLFAQIDREECAHTKKKKSED